MQLLVKFLVAFSYLIFGYALAGEKCKPESIKKEDILNCIAVSHSIVDEILNDRYKKILNRGDFEYKKLLVEGERLWINYRDARCKYIYDSIYPGEEAEIEKKSCELSSVYSRLLELIYIESAVKDTSLERFMTVINGRDRMREEYNSLVIEAAADADEDGYFRKNCELVGFLYGEKLDDCIRRMKIQNL